MTISKAGTLILKESKPHLVVQKMDSAIHWINRYPAHKYWGNQLRHPVGSDLSNGYCAVHLLHNWCQVHCWVIIINIFLGVGMCCCYIMATSSPHHPYLIINHIHVLV